ncbi:Uncharacterised protein [uncultured archaeon]|nr:Uncharacterised protein [uncultured archaeon]
MQKNLVKKVVICGILVLLISSGVVSALYRNPSVSSKPMISGNWVYAGGSGPGNYNTNQNIIDTANPAISEKLTEKINLKNQLLKTNIFLYNNTWSVETVDNSGSVGHFSDIAVAADNTVFISYCDFDKNDLKCARLINNEWNITVVDSEGNVGQCASLALDSLGDPHISYYDATNHVLKHAYFDGTEWQREVVDSSGNVGLDTSIAIDSTNHIHISYHDETNGDLKYAKSTENGWDIQVVDLLGDTGEISSITLDKNNTPHISYTNRYDFHLYHAYYSGNTWVIETVDDTSILYGSTSITYDPDGFIHILYYDVTPDHFSLKHAYQSHDGWHSEIIDPYLWGTFGTGGANIVFDNLGRIHVGYFNWAWQTVNYAWKINGIWNLEIIDSPIYGYFDGMYAALAVDPQGTPHVSYMDMNNMDLKYARKIEYSSGVPTQPSGSSNGKTGKAYTFTTTSQDFDNDKIQYGWDWNGDEEVDEWTGFYDSGEICEISHTWNETGSFKIRVIAMDEKGFYNGYHVNENGEFSYWSDSLPITMPYSYNKPIRQFLEWLFERFPNTFPVVQLLLEQ